MDFDILITAFHDQITDPASEPTYAHGIQYYRHGRGLVPTSAVLDKVTGMVGITHQSRALINGHVPLMRAVETYQSGARFDAIPHAGLVQALQYLAATVDGQDRRVAVAAVAGYAIDDVLPVPADHVAYVLHGQIDATVLEQVVQLAAPFYQAGRQCFVDHPHPQIGLTNLRDVVYDAFVGLYSTRVHPYVDMRQ